MEVKVFDFEKSDVLREQEEEREKEYVRIAKKQKQDSLVIAGLFVTALVLAFVAGEIIAGVMFL